MHNGIQDGTNDYGVKKLIPAEVIVSRTLQAKNRSFSNVIWRSGKPALDSEWNLINDMSAEVLTNYIKSNTPSGWLELGKNKFTTNSGVPNNVQFYAQDNMQELASPNAIVNGWPLLVSGTSFIDTTLNSIMLTPASSIARTDFVYLEVWRAQVRSRDTNNYAFVQNKPSTTELWGFGNVKLGSLGRGVSCTRAISSHLVTFTTNIPAITTSGDKLTVRLSSTLLKDYVIQTINSPVSVTLATNVETDVDSWSNVSWEIRSKNFSFIDDLVDVAIKPSVNGIETSQRVQIQYAIRVVPNVLFTDSESKGFNSANVQGQGANPNPQVASYDFVNMKDELGDAGLWRSGHGDQASQVALGTVDGYSYAIPMFKINRRSTITYNDTGVDQGTAAINQQGNASILGGISDRPDNKFNDGIDVTDIVDLRMKIFPSGANWQEIIEKNIDILFRGMLKSNRAPELFYDSIANTDVIGYNDKWLDQGASGKRTYWSDAPTQQTDIFAEVKTITTSNSLDVYRASGTGNWHINDTIIVQILPTLPTGTIIPNNPRVYVENTTFNSAVTGTWTGVGTNIMTFRIDNIISPALSNYDIWVYYDISLPAGQGIKYVPNDVLRVNYANSSAFVNGSVVRGMRLDPVVTRYQDLFDHCFENETDIDVFSEIEIERQRKQLKISPLIESTSVRNGATRVLEVETLNKTAKTIYVPYPIQHLRGVYTNATGGTEIATQSISGLNVTSIDLSKNEILVSTGNFVAKLTSLKYDSSGSFTGSEIELLVVAGGNYGPVFQHRTSTTPFGTRVKLYSTTGAPYILTDPIKENYKWQGNIIKVRSGSDYGFDLNSFVIDCKLSDNNSIISSMADRQQLWVDMDYLGAAHQGAELRIIYQHTPYQGSDVGNQNVSLLHKREKGFFFNNGTGGSVIDPEGITGTSNCNYTPLSPNLPGSFEDYRRNGATIALSSTGTPRFQSDIWSSAIYDVYGYSCGGSIWVDQFTVPASPEITKRGFLSEPILQTIFEKIATDAVYAEFVLPLLVKNRLTGEVYLLIQIGNKGIHIIQEGPILLDIFHLDERVIVK